MHFDLRPTCAGIAAAGGWIGHRDQPGRVLYNVGGEDLRLQLMRGNKRCRARLIIPVHNRAGNKVGTIDGESEASAARSDGHRLHWAYNLRHGILGEGRNKQARHDYKGAQNLRHRIGWNVTPPSSDWAATFKTPVNTADVCCREERTSHEPSPVSRCRILHPPH